MRDENDPVWTAAWEWVQREHDRDGLDDAARAEMTAWLIAAPAHRRAYEKAAKLWLLAGLVPPASDIDCPEDEPSDPQD